MPSNVSKPTENPTCRARVSFTPMSSRSVLSGCGTASTFNCAKSPVRINRWYKVVERLRIVNLAGNFA